jgi:hypothetical protein
MTPANRNYLVVGAGKSGTTALHYSIVQALRGRQAEVRELFEPRTLDDIRAGCSATASNVVKVIADFFRPAWLDEVRQLFQKRLFIHRDPRDVLISRLLYKPRDMDFVTDPAKLAEFLAVLEDKQANPSAVSVVDLYRLVERLAGIGNFLSEAIRVTVGPAGLWPQVRQDFFAVRYEDFVDGEVAALRDYLELPVDSGKRVQVDPRFARVTRTKGSGQWRQWFTPADVAYFGEPLAGYLAAFAYADDWGLDPAPTIESRHGSEYVQRIVQARHGQARKAV